MAIKDLEEELNHIPFELLQGILSFFNIIYATAPLTLSFYSMLTFLLRWNIILIYLVWFDYTEKDYLEICTIT